MQCNCKGEIKMGVKTLSKECNGINLKVTNFPIKICDTCQEYTSLLSDGVMVDLYMKELVKAGGTETEIKVDFPVVARLFDGKDLFEEIQKA